MEKELNFVHDHSSPFELVLVTRDANGEPTGKKQCIADSGYALSQFYLRHKGKPKGKKKTDDKVDTSKIVKKHGSMQSYVDTTEREEAMDAKIEEWHRSEIEDNTL